MPRARTTRGRLRQVERWLVANHPTLLPVRVTVTRVREGSGETNRVGSRFMIRIGRLALRAHETFAIEVLLHEWAHCLAWQVALEGQPQDRDHCEAWGVWYARLYESYFDLGGVEDSAEFSASPWG